MRLEKNKKGWQILVMILVITIILQMVHPMVALAAKSLEELSFGIQNLTITVLNPKGDVFPYADIELVKTGEHGYEKVGYKNVKTDELGKVNFEGMSFESTVRYGVIIKGEFQNPLEEGNWNFGIWFVDLIPDIYDTTISLEGTILHKLDIQSYSVDDIVPNGDMRCFTIFGENSMGKMYSTVINTFELNKSIFLMKGDYSIQMCANHYSKMMPSYFFTKQISLTSDEEIAMVDSNYSNIKFILPNESYRIQAISIYPKGIFKSSIFYSAQDTYISPGSYKIIYALSKDADENWAYFFEKDIIIGENKNIEIKVDDNFNSIITADKNTMEKGETINFVHEIKDSYGNKLIGKTMNLDISSLGDTTSWINDAPTLKIFDSENDLVYEEKLKRNEDVLEKWRSWNKDMDQNVDLIPMPLDKNNTFFSSQFNVPEDILGGIYTAKLDLGDGPHNNLPAPTTFIILGEESAPVLEPLKMYTNQKNLIIKGTATPGKDIEIYYSYEDGEDVLLGEAKSILDTGKFEIDFIPNVEGKYTYFVKEKDGNKFSIPLTVFVDWTAPSKPKNLEGISYNASSIDLIWDVPEGEMILEYEIYRDGKFISTTSVPYYKDTGLINGIEYIYGVVAIDMAGNKSESAELRMETLVSTELVIDKINWKASWSMNNLIIPESNIDISIIGSANKSSVAKIEYIDLNNQSFIVETTMLQIDSVDENGLAIYKGLFEIPSDAKRIDKIMGVIFEAHRFIEKEASGLPCTISGGINIGLSLDPSLGVLKDLNGGELEVSSVQSRMYKKILLSGLNKYIFEDLVPANDYSLVLRKDKKVLTQYDNVEIIGGTMKVIDMNVKNMVSSLDVNIKDRLGASIDNSRIYIYDEMGRLLSLANYNSKLHIPSLISGTTLIIKTEVLYGLDKYSNSDPVSIIVGPGKNNVDIILKDREKAILKGNIQIEHMVTNLKDITITAYQDVDGRPVVSTTKTDEDGYYSLEVLPGKASLNINYKFAKTMERKIEDPFVADEIRTLDMTLEHNSNIDFYIYTQSIGGEPIRRDLDARELVHMYISARNKGSESNPKGYSFRIDSYPNIYVVDGEPGDIIEIQANGYEMNMTVETATTVLDKNKRGKIELRLKEKGKIKSEIRTEGGQLTENQQYWVDIFKYEEGINKYIDTNVYNKSSFALEGLDEGVYKLAFRGSPYHGVNDFEFMKEELKDKAVFKEDIVVENLREVDLGEIYLSTTDLSKPGYFVNRQGNGFTTDKYEATPGSVITLRGQYKFDRGVSEINNLELNYAIPEGAKLVWGSEYLDVKRATIKPTINISEDKITLEFGRAMIQDIEGTFTYKVRMEGYPDKSVVYVKSWAEFKRTGDIVNIIREEIGSIIMRVPHINMKVNSIVTTREIEISGNADPGTELYIYDGSFLLGGVKVSEYGTWKKTVVLPDKGKRSNHWLRAETIHGGNIVYSSKKYLVTYDATMPKVVMMSIQQKDGRKYDITPGYKFPYVYNPGEPFTIEITFDDSSRVKNLFIFTEGGDVLSGDKVTELPLRNKFIITGMLEKSIIPGAIFIDYELDSLPFSIDDDIAKTLEEFTENMSPELRDAVIIPESFSQNLVLTPDSDGDGIDEFHKLEMNIGTMIKDIKGKDNIKFSMKMEIINPYEESRVLEDTNPLDSFNFEFNEEDGTFEITGYMPSRLIFNEVNQNEVNQNQRISKGYSTLAALPIGFLVKRVPTVLVKIYGKQTILEAAANTYTAGSNAMSIKGYNDYNKKIDKLNSLLSSPCFDSSQNDLPELRSMLESNKNANTFFTAGNALLSGVLLAFAIIAAPISITSIVAVTIGTFAVGAIVEYGLGKVQTSMYNTAESVVKASMKRDSNNPLGSCPPGPKPEKDGDEYKHKDRLDPKWIYDPSGYVYEGSPENRLEGVTTTVFYQENGEWVLWDADWYEQANPLITDQEGKYAWDVPPGLWKVLYEKEGYETTESEVLPVPPPQTEVNIEMKSLGSPMVEDIININNGINISFDKYMKNSTINKDTVRLKLDEEKGDGGRNIYIEGVVKSESLAGSDVSKRYKFIPDEPLEADKSYTIWISSGVQSYADITMKDEISAIIQGCDDGSCSTIKWPDSKEKVAANKTWNIEFSEEVNDICINSSYFYVRDKDGYIVPTIVGLGVDNKTITISRERYESGKTYTLYISKEVKNTNNKSLTKNIKMDFTIK